MSATCPPQYIHAILHNLKLDSRDVRFPRAELTRPKIRLIRRAFKRPLKASVRGIFAHHTVVPTNDLVPTLLYAGTQNNTLEYLITINSSRGHPSEAGNAHSQFARRYHANTGPNTKLNAVAMYVAGTLAVLCCTLALGLGQNWKRVRRVVIVGRQNPCNFIQMAGRSGRDQRRGLGILLVEHKRTNGKNAITDFKTPTLMTDDDRMDALAITPVCLRVALAVDLQHGYIPLVVDAAVVTEEAQRQLARGMAPCDCSNCKPEEAEALWLAQPALTNENFDCALAMGKEYLLQMVQDLPEPPPPPPVVLQPVAMVCGPDDPILDSPILEALVTHLERSFNQLFYEVFPDPLDLGPGDFFGRDMAWDVAKNIDLITQPQDFAIILSSKTVAGQCDCLFVAYCQWKNEHRTADVVAEAAKFRAGTFRADTSMKVPQSVEGAEMAHLRAEEEKRQLKLSREQAKEAATLAKAVAKTQREAAKKEAAALRESKKEAALAQRMHLSERSQVGKRGAEDSLQGRPLKTTVTAMAVNLQSRSLH